MLCAATYKAGQGSCLRCGVDTVELIIDGRYGKNYVYKMGQNCHRERFVKLSEMEKVLEKFRNMF